MLQLASFLATVLLATRVAGHGAVTSYVIGGTTYPGYTGFSPASSPPTIQWQWPNYDPTLNPAQNSVKCNGGTSAALSANVAAGGTVTAKYSQWTHAEGSISVYLFKCSSAFSACTGNGAGWFKIDEAGLLSGTMYSGKWGAGLVLNTLQWTSTIPASLEPGNYLIRHELIAVHQSNSPQFYAECAQIVVIGSGTAFPSGDYLVSIPGYASLSDSNVRFDIYSEAAKSITSWDVPGPPVWPSGTPPIPSSYAVLTSTTSRASSSSRLSSSSSSVRSSSSSSSIRSSSSSSSTRASSTTSSSYVPTTTSSAYGPGITLWGQCGGKLWTGSNWCLEGTCVRYNDFYSQCIP